MLSCLELDHGWCNLNENQFQFIFVCQWRIKKSSPNNFVITMQWTIGVWSKVHIEVWMDNVLKLENVSNCSNETFSFNGSSGLKKSFTVIMESWSWIFRQRHFHKKRLESQIGQKFSYSPAWTSDAAVLSRHRCVKSEQIKSFESRNPSNHFYRLFDIFRLTFR